MQMEASSPKSLSPLRDLAGHPTFQQIWYRRLGYQYLPDAPALSEAACVCCGSEEPCIARAAEVLCAPCWTLSAKKPMASKAIKAGPNGAHVVIASMTRLRYEGDLKSIGDVPAGTEILPPRNPELIVSEFLMRTPEEPTFLVRMDRAYREIVRSCRITVSPRSVHVNGPHPQCVDSLALRAVISGFGDSLPEARDLARFSDVRRWLGRGPLAGEAYTSAQQWMEEQFARSPALSPYMPTNRPWLVEPDTDTWTAMTVCIRLIKRGDLSL